MIKQQPKWDYVHGLVLTSFEQLYKNTGNEKYFNYIKGYADACIDSTGAIPSYKFEDYNIDMIEAGNILFQSYTTLQKMKNILKQCSCYANN